MGGDGKDKEDDVKDSGRMTSTPTSTDFTAGHLVAFTVGQGGTATGGVVPLRVEFMGRRAQRIPRPAAYGTR